MTRGRSKALFFASLGWLLAPLAAQARVLAQTAEPNPFLPTPGSSPSPAAAPLSPTLPAAAAPLAPAPPASAPVAEYDPCACTTTGFSAGLNTNTVGCGQHELVAGSAAFSCFINDPRLCLQAGPLTPSQSLPGAASRQCSEQEAQAYLPRVSTLIVNTPQLISFANALRQANLSSIPGTQVTIFAPSNQAFSAAKANGVLTPEQLQDPALLKKLILASIVPRRLTAADLLAAGSVTTEGGQQLPVASLSSGQLIVGAGSVLLQDVLASNGVIHITDGWVWQPPLSVAGIAPAAESQPAVQPIVPALELPPPPAPEQLPPPTVSEQPAAPPAPESEAATPSPFSLQPSPSPAPAVISPFLPAQTSVPPPSSPSPPSPPPPSPPPPPPSPSAPPQPTPSPPPPPPSPSPPPPPPSPSPPTPPPSPSPPPPPPPSSPVPVPQLPAVQALSPPPLPPPRAPASPPPPPPPAPLSLPPGFPQLDFGSLSPSFQTTAGTGPAAASDLASQLTGGCACTSDGMSGGVQTGQVGCACRLESGFLQPISLCCVRDPSTCIAATQSRTYPGAEWKLC